MFKLNVPYIAQNHPNSCGPACLEMIYKFFDLNNISQTDLFEKYKEPNTEDPNILFVKTNKLAEDAKNNNFEVIHAVFDIENNHNLFKEIKEFIEINYVPIMVCQQFRKEESHIGHFRVIIGFTDSNEVILHDPHPEFGGDSQVWSQEKFIDFWRKTGTNVVGGEFFYIKK